MFDPVKFGTEWHYDGATEFRANRDTEGMWVIHDRTLYFSIRGSEPEAGDWRSNILGYLLPLKVNGVGWVQRDFWRKAESALAEYRRVINEQEGYFESVLLTGHSQGGAIALCLAEITSQPAVV